MVAEARPISRIGEGGVALTCGVLGLLLFAPLASARLNTLSAPV
jgi:hypothetical protein